MADATLELHHMVIHGALEAAVHSRLIGENVAKRVNKDAAARLAALLHRS